MYDLFHPAECYKLCPMILVVLSTTSRSIILSHSLYRSPSRARGRAVRSYISFTPCQDPISTAISNRSCSMLISFFFASPSLNANHNLRPLHSSCFSPSNAPSSVVVNIPCSAMAPDNIIRQDLCISINYDNGGTQMLRKMRTRSVIAKEPFNRREDAYVGAWIALLGRA